VGYYNTRDDPKVTQYYLRENPQEDTFLPYCGRQKPEDNDFGEWCEHIEYT
jgi:hypothetical protein